MRLRILALLCSTLVTALAAYINGRFFVAAVIPLWIIPGLAFLLLSLLVLVPRTGDGSRWNRSSTRIVALGLCWLILFGPSVCGDGYFELGRGDHVRSPLLSP
jgi:hypothetical protein